MRVGFKVASGRGSYVSVDGYIRLWFALAWLETDELRKHLIKPLGKVACIGTHGCLPAACYRRTARPSFTVVSANIFPLSPVCLDTGGYQQRDDQTATVS
jgi:hypothetical protein